MTKRKSSERGKRLDGYIRVSAVMGREGDSYITIPQQRDKIEAWARVDGHEIIRWETDEDQSGGKLHRPGLDAIMGRIRRGESDGIAVAYLSRFSRLGVADALKLIEEIESHGAVVLCAQEKVDTSNPMGRFALTIFLALNAMERERIGESWVDANQRAVSRGIHRGRIAPFGYVKRPDGGLAPDPVAAPIVQEMFRMRAAGASPGKIREAVAASGVRTGDNGPLGGPGIHSILKNDVYLGILRWGGRPGNKTAGVVKEGAHPPLVDYATWQAAQQRRGARWKTGEKRDPMLLNGLVRCASCRYTMGTHRAPNGGIYMLCTRARQYGDCPDPVAVRVNDLKRDHVVDTDHEALGLEEIVTRMLLEEKVPALDLEARAYGAAAGVTELGNEVKSAKLVLDGYMAEREDIIESASRDAFLTGLQARQRALDDARTAYETALAEHGAGVTESFRSLRDDWATMTVAERRDQLSSVVRCVFVRNAPQQQYGVSRDRVHVVWIDDPEVDLPRQGRRNYVIHPFAFDGRDDPRHVGVAP